MDVKVETRHVTLPAHADADIAERLRSGFGRLATRIARLKLTLKDINGPRGGKDKVCVLQAHLTDGRQLVIEDRSERLRTAVTACLKRGRLVVSRELKRRRQPNRKPQQPWAHNRLCQQQQRC